MADGRAAGVVGGAAASTPGISFGFARTSTPRRRVDPGDRVPSAPDEAAAARGLRGEEPPEASAELVIPVIPPGRRRQRPAPRRAASADTGPSVPPKLLRRAPGPAEGPEEKTPEAAARAGAGPPRAGTPMEDEDEEEEGAARAPRGQAAPPDADYGSVPVEAYGLAMLRGMGWKPGAGIGRTCRPAVRPRAGAPRPKGLGLGAAVPSPEGEGEEDAEAQGGATTAWAARGDAVEVLCGPHRGLRGTVEGCDPDNARALVRPAAGGRVVTVSEHCLRPAARSARRPGQGRAGALRSQDAPAWGKRPPGTADGPVAPKEKTTPQSEPWLRRDLRVRLVDRRHRGGQYYNTKLTVEDVLGADTCVCRTDEGRVLEGLRGDMLETVVPKGLGQRVMVVLGPQAGRLGQLMGRDRLRHRALVRLRGERELVQLDFDAICQYVGPGDLDED